ncbi:hypothetical protein GMRT_12546 [Giardia muris]|uniref:Uncharacterized protein n=1 Tax=Giardia muris TaxID=5742 RepID=A0A4Z1SR90_GIAMU|nr:hypothetical protein GMRT_12546 [Giardia muris]|eukprot:TNJ28414.1 hypothetical protein GMRT_12546 [Giardia muris]
MNPELLTTLRFGEGYLRGTSAYVNRYGLISSAIQVASTAGLGSETTPKIPTRSVGRRGYRSSIIALETWLTENLSLLSSERLSPEMARDLAIAIYCGVAAGIASQKPTLTEIMAQLIDVLSNSCVSASQTEEVCALEQSTLDVRDLANRLLQTEGQAERYEAQITSLENRLRLKIREFDSLTTEIIDLRSHIMNLRTLVVTAPDESTG